MPNGCCVKGCRSNFGKREVYVPLFKFPKDVELRQKWFDCIPRRNRSVALTTIRFPGVCHKHFPSSDIITEDRFDVDGKMFVMPRERLKLRKGAVPSIFNNLSSDGSDLSSVTRMNSSPISPFFLETVWDDGCINDSDNEQPPTPLMNPYVQLETLKLINDKNENISLHTLIGDLNATDPVKDEAKEDLDNEFLLITNLIKNGSEIQNGTNNEFESLLITDPIASDPFEQEIDDHLESASLLDPVKTEIENKDEAAYSDADNKSDVASLYENGVTTESNEGENETCKYCKQKKDDEIICKTPPKLFTNVEELLTCLKYNDMPSDFISLQRDKSICFIIYDSSFSPTVLASAVIGEDLQLFLFINSVQLKRLGDHDFPRKVTHINALKCILNLLKVKVL